MLLIMSVLYRYLTMLTSFHLLLYMFHYLLLRNYLYYMFHYFTLLFLAYYKLYNYLSLHSYNPNFMPHLYIIDNMFMLHLSSYSIMHFMLMMLDLPQLSLSSNLPLLASSFTNSMLLLILNLYISTSLSDSPISMYLYYSMSLLVLMYPYIPLLLTLPALTLLSLDSLCNLLVHFHYSLPSHSMHIHSLLYMSHLSSLMNYIYNFILILHLLLHFMLLMLMLSYSLQTMHYNSHYSLCLLVLYYSLLSLSHLALLPFII